MQNSIVKPVRKVILPTESKKEAARRVVKKISSKKRLHDLDLLQTEI